MFNADQLKELSAPLSRENVKTRSQSGRSLSYIEGWHCIAEANRIFGFDGWTRETVEIKCVSERDREIGAAKAPGHSVTYIARVRIVAGGVVRDGCGSGHGIDRDLGQAHESAIKEAETDAMKRALMTFGNPFGLALYDKEQAHVVSGNGNGHPPQDSESKLMFIRICKKVIAQTKDAKDLEEWWKSPEHKHNLRLHELTQAEIDELKDLVIAKLPKKPARVETPIDAG